MLDWLKRNKLITGFVAACCGLYVQWQCPGFEGHCDKVSDFFKLIGAFLAGGGYLNSDYREKFVQENKKTFVVRGDK